ncbi:hypothetical protein [Pseudomonas cichorii]|uniref:hypothetical protein n=1 Tax=Pseudomonas cichorii TaxID=36746 RepID=UPI001C895858|nr:hypothetical protein [Pseudomonas cichorii]MBX8496577.1 hypothetical protein [Pseudomonas cichorii]
MKKKYLLVVEGPTDFIIIKHMAKKLTETSGHEIEIHELSPSKDATSGTYPAHGWSGVKRWCEKFSRNKDPIKLNQQPQMMQQFLRRLNWPALIASSNADGIIIQIDTDIAHALNNPEPYTENSCRTTHCRNSIVLWLNEPKTPDEIYLALSTYAIENWILATHHPTEAIFNDLPQGFSYEAIHDFEDRLVQLGYPTYNEKGRDRLLKSPSGTYEPHGEIVAENLQSVRSRCSAADALCIHLES